MEFGGKITKTKEITLRGVFFLFYDPEWYDQRIQYSRLFFEPEDIDGEYEII